jgi:hypothetical protein
MRVGLVCQNVFGTDCPAMSKTTAKLSEKGIQRIKRRSNHVQLCP